MVVAGFNYYSIGRASRVSVAPVRAVEVA